jgi:hypothetical protein
LAKDQRVEKLEGGDLTSAFLPAVGFGQPLAKIGTEELRESFSKGS